MTKKYRVHEFVRFDYSEIGEYIDEYHTDRPLRNDELVDLLNNQEDKIKELQEENEQLKNEIKMLKSTIARNEAYITRLTKKGKWTK